MFLFLQRLHEANDRGDSLLHSRITDGRVFLILLLEIIAPERHPEAFVRSLHIAAIDVSIDLLERELPAVSPAKLRDVRRIRFAEVSSFSGAGCSVAGCAKSIEVMLTRGLALSGRVETGYHKTEHNGDEDRSEDFFYGWVHRILTLTYGGVLAVYTNLVSLPARAGAASGPDFLPRARGSRVIRRIPSRPCSFPADLPALELSEHRAFLDLMVLHSLEDVIQGCHRITQVRSLIEHHALRAAPHRGVGDLGP